MAIVAVSLGSSPTGAGGDTNREAFTKINTSIGELDVRASIGLEAVSGGAGFTNVPVAPATTVALDLATGRAFHHTMIADLTGVTFSNTPTTTEYAAAWTWVLAIDATGGYTLAGTPTVTFVDGHSFADANLTASAVNIFTFWQVGATTYGALVTNGALSVDPYVLSFPADGAQLVPITRAETLAFGSVTNVEADGTAGTGTLTFKRNGGADITGNQAFTAGQVLTVTMAGSTTASAVSIPRSV